MPAMSLAIPSTTPRRGRCWIRFPVAISQGEARPPCQGELVLCSADLDAAEAADVEAVAEGCLRKAGRDDAAGHHDVAFLQSLALHPQMIGEPCERLERMAESVRALAPPDFDTILIGHAYDVIER